MSSFDLLLGAVVAGAAWCGWRVGLVRGAFAWVGFGSGLALGVRFVDDVTNRFASAPPNLRFLIAVVFLLLVVVIVQTLGWALGAALSAALPRSGPAPALDRGAGAVLGAAAVLALLWLLIPALASTPGWLARGVRGSWLARQVQALAPEPPSPARDLGRLVAEAPFPEVFRRLTDARTGPPPVTGLDEVTAARVLPGVVRVQGQACQQVVDGSGFAASPDAVVTNAHVVAGERSTWVYTQDGRRRDAVVVAFDPARDLALLRVRGGELVPLPLGEASVGTTGAVVGHPGGGPVRAAPARVDRVVDAHGTDIYRRSPTRRAVLVLAAHLVPGDSGAPFVDGTGRVVGVAFAVDPADATTAYALTRSELDAFLGAHGGAASPVDTGPCLVG